MQKFRKDERGNVAMIFAAALAPIFLLMGAALDYNRLVSFRDRVRDIGDSVALAIGNADSTANDATLLTTIKQRLQEEYGTIADISDPTGSWRDGDATYVLKIHASLKTYVLPAVEGLIPRARNGKLPVDVEIKVARIPAQYETEKPTLSLLDPEAGDYNRIYMYCYNAKKADAADKGRRGMTPIADNGTDTKTGQKGLTYKDALPVCGEGELISYMLRNVRNARSSPSKWDAKGQEVYQYWTDTTIDYNTKVLTQNIKGTRVDDAGKPKGDPIDVTTVNAKEDRRILETIVCDSVADCKPVKDGGKIPNRTTNRPPKVASSACTSGKYMYFGWEDRPGGDRDFDDIRLVVSCPKQILKANKQVRLSY